MCFGNKVSRNIASFYSKWTGFGELIRLDQLNANGSLSNNYYMMMHKSKFVYRNIEEAMMSRKSYDSHLALIKNVCHFVCLLKRVNFETSKTTRLQSINMQKIESKKIIIKEITYLKMLERQAGHEQLIASLQRCQLVPLRTHNLLLFRFDRLVSFFGSNYPIMETASNRPKSRKISNNRR